MAEDAVSHPAPDEVRDQFKGIVSPSKSSCNSISLGGSHVANKVRLSIFRFLTGKKVCEHNVGREKIGTIKISTLNNFFICILMI
jgi:hypothetical protein